MATKKRIGRKPVIGRRPRSLRSDSDTREAILNAARSVFARQGFDGTSTREVADTARVNSAMIYYHFKDKVELYRAVLSDSFEAMDRVWEHEIFRSSAPAREKIRQYVEELIRFQHTNEDFRKILSMEFALCGSNMKWMSDNFFSNSYSRLAGIIKEGIRNGEMKKIDPAVGLCALVGMVIHSFILRPIAEYVTGKSMDLAVKQFSGFVTGMFFDGLGMDTGARTKLCKRGIAL